MVEVAVAEALVQAWAAVRGLASIHPLVRCGHAWSFQFERLPSFSKPFWALWSEQVVEVVGAEAEMAAWECRVQQLPGLLVYVKESAIGPSDVLYGQSHQQVARPRSSSSNRLWQPRQHRVEGAEEDCCSTLRVRQQCRRGFETSFEGWSLALHRCPAYAARRCPESSPYSADSSPARCAARRCCSVPVATAVSARGQCQTMMAQTAAGSLGARGSGCGPL